MNLRVDSECCRGNFDDSCDPCVLDAKEGSTDVLLLKCGCLDEKGVLKYTELEIGLHGMLLRLCFMDA